MRGLRHKMWVVMLILALSATACNTGGGEADGGGGDQEGGEAIEVAAVWTGGEKDRFAEVLQAFTEETGIEASFRSAGDDMAAFLGTQIEGGNPPDVAMIAQPALIRQLANDGSLQQLSDEVVQSLEDNFAQAWKDIGSVDGTPYAVYFKVANKSTWWYNTNVFQQAGVQAPESWDEMLDTANTVKQSGTPWVSMGGADGWTLTDWFENIYIRTAGAQSYDRLTEHEIPWTDDSVQQALQTWAELVSQEDLIAGGASGAINTSFEESVKQVWADPPKAASVYEADFVAGVITAETNATQEDFDFFRFPSIDGSAPAVVAAGDGGVALTDNPSAMEFLEFLTTPEAAEAWASEGGFLSPNRNLELDTYPDDITRSLAQSIVEAGNEVRFDMSDLAPPEFGGTTGQGLWKLFQDFVRSPDNIDRIQKQLEQAAQQAYGG